MDKEIIKQVADVIIAKYEDSEKNKLMRETVEKLNLILIGNGKVGLCEQVRKIKSSIVPLWWLVSICGASLITGVIALMLKK
jgi:hypothetical protein